LGVLLYDIGDLVFWRFGDVDMMKWLGKEGPTAILEAGRALAWFNVRWLRPNVTT
jgi:hypothetical protein